MLDTPTDGEYTLAGEPVTHQLTPSQRARIRNRQIGFIFQAFNLIGDLTVYENVELPLTYRGMSAAERKQRVTDALERVGMSHRMKHYPAQLSGGQQQRVAVARAVSGDPLILLADEPTGNLDSTNGEAVMELLRELHRGGATICMVTHDPRYAAHADRSIPPVRRPSRRRASLRKGVRIWSHARETRARRGRARSLTGRSCPLPQHQFVAVFTRSRTRPRAEACPRAIPGWSSSGGSMDTPLRQASSR